MSEEYLLTEAIDPFKSNLKGIKSKKSMKSKLNELNNTDKLPSYLITCKTLYLALDKYDKYIETDLFFCKIDFTGDPETGFGERTEYHIHPEEVIYSRHYNEDQLVCPCYNVNELIEFIDRNIDCLDFSISYSRKFDNYTAKLLKNDSIFETKGKSPHGALCNLLIGIFV